MGEIQTGGEWEGEGGKEVGREMERSEQDSVPARIFPHRALPRPALSSKRSSHRRNP